MNLQLGTARVSKSEAVRLREEKKFEQARESMERAIDILAVELDRLGSLDEEEQELSGFYDVALELSDCYGSLGGIERRQGRLVDAIRSYEKGMKLERDSRYRIENSYNFGNYLTLSILADAQAIDTHKDPLRRLVERIAGQVRRGHRNDLWAQADLAKCHLLIGGDEHLAEADVALRRFGELGGMSEGYETTLAVFQQLQRALADAGRSEAAGIEEAIRRFVAARFRTAVGTAASLPPLSDGEYHCFISYRSTDRPVALDLLHRFEALGLRVFLDQIEMAPGHALARTLESAIDKCRSAVVLISKGWLESTWCRQEGDALLTRRINHPDFRLVPLRLDDAEMPGFFNTAIWLQWPTTGAVDAGTFTKLCAGLFGTAVRFPVDLGESTEQELRAAEKRGPDALADRWATVCASGGNVRGAALLTGQLLIHHGRFTQALKALDYAANGVTANTLRGLALARLGRLDEALILLETTAGNSPFDAEVLSVLAGRYKELWRSTGRKYWLERALDLYEKAWLGSRQYYPGINVAAVSLWLGDSERSREMANAVLGLLPAQEKDSDAWQRATRAEALLLLGELDAAWPWYRAAVKTAGMRTDQILTMRKQARTHLKYLGKADSASAQLSAALALPAVAAFTGHMTDPPSTTAPRLGEAQLAAARQAILEQLERHDVQYAVTSLARGGDLLFAELCLETGRELEVFLPFPRAQFKLTSIRYPETRTAEDRRLAGEWSKRFDAVLAALEKQDASRIKEGPSTDDPDAAYRECNGAIRQAAQRRAEKLDQQPILIALWDGESNGTGDAVDDWKAAGLPEPIVISPKTLPSR